MKPRETPCPSRTRHAPARLALAIGFAVASNGCGVLQPHITMPERLANEPGLLTCKEGSATAVAPKCEPRFYGGLAEAFAGTSELRSKYLQAMRGETLLGNLTLAALIPLTAAALYKGVNSSGDGTQRFLLRAGVGGAAAYAGVTTFVSKPRQQVYLAGADALGCLLVASRPYLWTTDDMGDARTPGTFVGDLHALSVVVAIRERAVLAARKQHDTAVAARQERTEKAKSDARQKNDAPAVKKPQASRPPMVLADPSEFTDPAARKIIEDTNRAIRSGRTPVKAASAPASAAAEPAPTEPVLVVPPELSAAEASLVTARSALQRGAVSRARIDSAGTRLRDGAWKVGNQVDREILNTVPEVSSIFAVAGSLQSTAFRLTGATKLAPAVAQSGGDKRFSLAGTERESLAAAAVQLDAAAGAVMSWVTRMDELSATVGQVTECRFAPPSANNFTVVPSETEIEMSANSRVTFSVFGGSGIPRVSVPGGQAGPEAAYELLKPGLDASGGYAVTFVLRASATPADRPLIVFSDSTAGVKHQVQITVVGGSPAADEAKGATSVTAPTGTLSPTPPAVADATADASKTCTVEALREKLGLSRAGGVDKAFTDKVAICRARPGVPASGEPLDSAFCKAVIDERKCP